MTDAADWDFSTGLTASWLRHWERDPHRLVVAAPVEGVRWTAAEFEHITRETAYRFAARGVRAQQRVVVSANPSAALIAAYVALLRLGATAVPANTAYTRAELEHICAAARVTAAVADDPTRYDGLCPALTPAQAQAGPSVAVPLDTSAPDQDAMVAFTSGTTGRPKAAVHTHRSLLAGALSVVQAWEWHPDDTLLLTLPLFHMHGLGVGLHGTFTAGASLHVLPRFDAQAVADQARETTMFFGVPTMYARLGEHLSALSGQRLLVSGSAPLDPVLFDHITREAGQPPLERYGMTETVMIAGNPLDGERRAGSVGLALPGVSIRLDEANSEVHVASRALFAGYEADGVIARCGDWFATGDIGAADPDGYLRLVGRASELIITGGYNVYPREVEDAILEHPAVSEAAVVGLPDATWGETVAAAYVGDVSESELERHTAGRLAAFKCPRAWRCVEALPRNAMGKVQRAEVRELFA